MGLEIEQGSRLLELKPYAIGGVVTDRTVEPGQVNDVTADLGGDLSDFTMLGSRRGYAIVAAESFEASVIEFDLEAGVSGTPLITSPLLLSDIEATEEGRLWVVDRDCFDPGLRVFDVAKNEEITAEPIYPGLTPFTLDFIR